MANYTLGLDLGKERDYSALVVAERIQVFSEELRDRANAPLPDHDQFHVLHAQRIPLKTSYARVVDVVSDYMRQPPLIDQTQIVIDKTGVGSGVVDMFKEAYKKGRLGHRWPRAYTITAGEKEGNFTVPKQDLVSTIEALLQTGRLFVAEGALDAKALRHELQSFRAKMRKSGHVAFEADRDADHDDLVVALAFACWYRHMAGEPRYITAEKELVEKHWSP